MDIHKVYGFFMKYFRPRRAKFILEKFPILLNPQASVLDLGGGAYPWDIINPNARVVILNIERPHTIPKNSKLEFVQGDATNLMYPDKSFDLVFSNSVIEHVGNKTAMQNFANEMTRVGKEIYCQTPNKWFPVEPHLITIIIHWLPFPITRRLVRYFSIWGVVNKPNQKKIDEFLLSIKLLSKHEIESIFPDCEIKSERVLGLNKSFVIVKK